MSRFFAIPIGLVGLVVITVALTVPAPPANAQEPAPAVDPPSREADRWVRRLGDASFAVRRRATSRLLELGIEARGALQRGVESPDREVSFRSRHLLQIVRANDFQRRLSAFAAGQERPSDGALPSWGQFAKEVGSGPEARTLFVEMQRAEPELLRELEENPERSGDALTERIAEIQESRQQGGGRDQLSLGTIATILFLLNSDEVELPRVFAQNIGAYFRYPSFAGAIQAGSQQDLLRKMLSVWIRRSEGFDAYHAIFLAMQYEMPVGLVPAKAVLQGEYKQRNHSYFLCYALLAFAKFGDRSHLELVEPLLGDETPYGGTLAGKNNARYRTQVRDIALAALVELAELDHEKFGFTRLRRSKTQVFDTGSLAFEDDTAREEAIAKWRKYREGQAGGG